MWNDLPHSGTTVASATVGSTKSDVNHMRSVSVALAVLEAVAERQPVGVSELARAMELPKSTMQRMLLTLGELGWIRAGAEEPTRWSLTSKAMSIGSRHRGDDEIRRVALPAMHALSAATGETVHLSVLEERRVVLIEKIESIHPVRTHTTIGNSAPLHTTASGKAILAAMPQAQARALLRAPLEALTERTQTDVPTLLEELGRAREDGYAVTVGTRHPEIAAVGAAVLGASGLPVASLSLSLPVHRFPEQSWPDLGEQVARAAAECSRELGWRPA
ncbi:IclR family transcriptional regulator [Geodermatophilus sp. DSM 44513]|uniref:IclR family transcriptional regulator n=1 Tax=Geodermatophilus sp. DSM 44513 TaxID=1528104 RepID=UPI001411D23D|nr:IclR family transcriptional regulator [Geodermatophilus sp. DSM 44513]WNV74361.1 IclR family transcriptional regulator [Geodermatophilus sp. DSM 44513]